MGVGRACQGLARLADPGKRSGILPNIPDRMIFSPPWFTSVGQLMRVAWKLEVEEGWRGLRLVCRIDQT